MDDELVTIMHAGNEWAVRASILRNCSVVFDSMLRDSDSQQPRIMHMDDVRKENVEAFLSLAKMTSHDSEMPFPSVSTLSKLTADAMPLVHKYDCKALLQMLQYVQNEQPNVTGIMSIATHEPESTDWMDNRAKLCVLQYIILTHTRDVCEEKLSALPQPLLSSLLMYAMFDLEPKCTFRDAFTEDTLSMRQYGVHSLKDLIPKP